MDRAPSRQLQQSTSVKSTYHDCPKNASRRDTRAADRYMRYAPSRQPHFDLVHNSHSPRPSYTRTQEDQKEKWTAIWYSRGIRAASRTRCRSQEGANAFEFAFVCVTMIICMALWPHARKTERGDATNMWLCTRVATFCCRLSLAHRGCDHDPACVSSHSTNVHSPKKSQLARRIMSAACDAHVHWPSCGRICPKHHDDQSCF